MTIRTINEHESPENATAEMSYNKIDNNKHHLFWCFFIIPNGVCITHDVPLGKSNSSIVGLQYVQQMILTTFVNTLSIISLYIIHCYYLNIVITFVFCCEHLYVDDSYDKFLLMSSILYVESWAPDCDNYITKSRLGIWKNKLTLCFLFSKHNEL